MPTDKLEQAWKQLKLKHAMPGIEANEILSMIEQSENSQKSNLAMLLLNAFIFMAITICCQGG